jgi:hypothetical protein
MRDADCGGGCTEAARLPVMSISQSSVSLFSMQMLWEPGVSDSAAALVCVGPVRAPGLHTFKSPHPGPPSTLALP